MVQLTTDQVTEICNIVFNYIEEASGDVAYQFDHPSDIEYSFPDIWEKYRLMDIKPLDWKGWLGDELYNSKDFVGDLAGDRIYDEIYKKIGKDILAKHRESDKNLFRKYMDESVKEVKSVFASRCRHIHGLFE